MKVGKDGVITVEEGRRPRRPSTSSKACSSTAAILSPHFVTNQDTQTVELENCLHPDLRREDLSAKKLIPLLEAISKANKPLLIIAEDIEGEALATLVVNKLRGILQRLCRQGPGYGDRRKAMLGDIAMLTGGTAIFKDLGIKLERSSSPTSARPRRSRITAEEHDDRRRRRQEGRDRGPRRADPPRDRQ